MAPCSRSKPPSPTRLARHGADAGRGETGDRCLSASGQAAPFPGCPRAHALQQDATGRPGKPPPLGYAVVIQDTRGRFASEGDNLPFNREDQDGFDTVGWIAQQGWCNGKIGTYGGSALGITQLQLGGHRGECLVCQHITVAEPDLYNVVYTGGVFRKALVEDWLRTSKFVPRRSTFGPGTTLRSLLAGAGCHPPLQGGQRARASYRRLLRYLCARHDRRLHGLSDQGGPGARGKQKLLLGPWTHGVLTEKAGDLVFPEANRPPNNVQDQTVGGNAT